MFLVFVLRAADVLYTIQIGQSALAITASPAAPPPPHERTKRNANRMKEREFDSWLEIQNRLEAHATWSRFPELSYHSYLLCVCSYDAFELLRQLAVCLHSSSTVTELS